MPVSEREPILRAEMASGQRFDDPSEDALYMLLTDLAEGDETFLILERLSDASGQTYMQVAGPDPAEYQVEYRDGTADSHFFARSADMRLVHQVLTAWAYGLGGWKDLLPRRPLTGR